MESIPYVTTFQFVWICQCNRSSQRRHSSSSFYVRYRKFSLFIVFGVLLQFVIDAQIKPQKLMCLRTQKVYSLSVHRLQVKNRSINCAVFEGVRKDASHISILALGKLSNPLPLYGCLLVYSPSLSCGTALLISVFNV